MDYLISIIGAGVSVFIAVAGVILNYVFSIKLKEKALKEEQYIGYFNALHNLGTDNYNNEFKSQYTAQRDRLIIIASPKVIKAIVDFESNIGNKEEENKHFNIVVKAIRKDLKKSNKNLPNLSLKK